MMVTRKSAMPMGSFFMLVLFLAVLCSGIAIIYNAHNNKLLLNKLYNKVSEYNKVQAEWGRLILEQSTWTSYSRVESLAINQLGMKTPAARDVRIIGE